MREKRHFSHHGIRSIITVDTPPSGVLKESVIMSGDFPIVFALYPRLTQLDFTAPLEVLARLPGATTVLAASRGGELSADGGVVFANVRALDEVTACALLCVPGGFGS